MDFTIPQIQTVYYKGQKVLSSNQLAALFKCKRQNITDVYRNHKADFIEGVDYFYLEKEELYKFKVENGIFSADDKETRDGNTCAVFPFLPVVRPFSRNASTAIVWTESGSLKQATFSRTKRAKLFLQTWLPQYFNGTKEIAPQPINSQLDKDFSPREKLNRLEKWIDICTDDNLRDELIRIALNILKSA